MSRRVVMLAMGSRGDIQPCVALGKELIARGDKVSIIASAPYERLITQAGLDFRGLTADPTQALASAEGKELIEGGRNPVRFIHGLRRLVAPALGTLMNEALDGCRDADLFLCPSIGYFGQHVNEHLGIPWALIHFQPTQPTVAFPHPLLPQAKHFGAWGNRMSFAAVEQVAWQLGRPFINPWRRNRLGLRPIPLRGPMERVQYDRRPMLCCFSPTVVPRPADWPSYVHVTGFWFLDPEPGWAPPADLVDFLDAGPPPVYVGFGSMVPKDLEETGRVIKAALRKAGVRGIVSGNMGVEADDDIHVLGDVPHTWLFPRMAAVVHHGGAGTTGAGLRAGVPSVICPFFGDQPYWGERVAALGAGPEPLPFDQMSPNTLAARIGEAVGSASMRARAAAVGRSLALEDGVRRACDVLSDPLLNGSGRPAERRPSAPSPQPAI